jgi:hypothetical integral membrane protein (TIGR02206 family)
MTADHVAALAVTAALCAAALATATRRAELGRAARQGEVRPGTRGGEVTSATRRTELRPAARHAAAVPVTDAWTRPLSRAFAAFLLGWFLAYPLVVLAHGSYELDFDLPLHLTDAVTLVGALALWTWRSLPFELTWFWGLTASLLAIVTPDLGADDRFPSFFYFHYFVTHGGVVVAALFLAFGVGLTARPGAVGRVFLLTAAWAAVAALGNAVTGGNYMFLREKPDATTLLDYMGPWPWYIATSAVLALVLFALLDLPFRRRRAGMPRANETRPLSPPVQLRRRSVAALPRSRTPGR